MNTTPVPNTTIYATGFNPVIKTDVSKPVMDEIASAATDLHSFQGWLPVMDNPDEVLNLEAGGDISLYDKIGSDPRVAACLRSRSKAVVGREWQVVPFSQETIDQTIADYVDSVLQKFPYDLCRRPVLRGGVLKGFSVAEVMWDYSEGDTFIRDMRYRHQRRFKFAPNGDLHLLTLGNPWPGINATRDEQTGLLLKKFQAFTFGDEVTTPYGNGLGKELYWPWFFKRSDIKFWLMFVEKFAAPTAAGEYPSGTDKAKQQELLAAAASLHSNSAIVYPEGMNLRLIEAARGGNISSYKELHDTMNDEMTICILGQLATTGAQAGKLGNSEEQNGVYEDYIKDDSDSLCESQNDRNNGIIPWLVDYQFPGHGRYPAVKIKCEDEEDGKTLAERSKLLCEAMANSGQRLTKSYFLRTHGLEEDDLEESPGLGNRDSGTKKPIKPAAPTQPEPAFAEEGDAEPDNADELLGLLMERAEAPLVAWLNALRREADMAGNLLDLRGDLLKVRTPLADMAAAIGDALLLGHLLGMAEVLAEADSTPAFSDPEILSALRLPFQEAISFFRNKVNIPTERWNDLFLDCHSKGFMIAGAMKGDLLNDLRDAVDQTIADGLTIREFRQQWDAIVERYGWTYVGGRNWRTRIVYETNTRQAYNAGRWEQQTDPDLLKTRPNLMYKHGDSVHPRPLHVSWDGTVLPADDPWWATHYVQNGWGCKCKIFSVGDRDIARIHNVKRTAPDDGSYEWTDKQGRTFTIPNGIDPGFQYNPGAAARQSHQILQERINQLPPDIAGVINREIKAKQ